MSERYLGYEMIIAWSEEDDAYIVAVPDLPGCMTHGESYTEAERQGRDAITSWLDAARSLGELPTDAEVEPIILAGAGNHEVWMHPLVPELLTLAGDDDDDAKPYQEKAVAAMLEKLRAIAEGRL